MSNKTIRAILENLTDPNDDSVQYDPPELIDKPTQPTAIKKIGGSGV